MVGVQGEGIGEPELGGKSVGAAGGTREAKRGGMLAVDGKEYPGGSGKEGIEKRGGM